MFRTGKLENDINKRGFLRLIFLYFLIPILIVSVSALGVYKYYKDLFQKELESNYIRSLSTVAENMDNSLMELQNTAILLSSDANLYNIFYSEKRLTAADGPKINSMTNTLIKFKATKSLIDSVYIVHKDSNQILDTSGTYSTDNFFKRYSNYSRYDKAFWMKLKISSTYFSVLKPSSVTDVTYGSPIKREVIPFVTSNLAGVKSNNLFVINLSEDEIDSILQKYEYSMGGTLAIIDRAGTIFSSSKLNINESVTKNKDFLKRLSNKNFFSYDINGTKTLVINYSSKLSKFNNFTYTAFIPYNNFYRQALRIKKLSYTIIFAGALLSIFVAYLMSRKIYRPIDNLVNILSNSEDYGKPHKNEVEYLNNRIKEILTNETNLKKDLSVIMPLASEQYLIKILTSSDVLLDEEVKNFIYNSQINFEYANFCVCLIEMNFTDKFYNSHNNDEYSLAVKGFSKIFERIALERFPTYMLNLSKNQLCLLINLDKEMNLEEIKTSIKNVLNLFDYDKDLLNILVGIGRIYSGFVGMNKSYNEARKALVALSPLGSNKINIYSKENISYTYSYSISDENKLFNYLIGGYKEEALSFLNLLIEKNYKDNPSEYALKKFYSSIHETVIRVLSAKDQNLVEFMENEYINLHSNLELMSISDINNYIFLTVNKILSVQKASSKVDIYQIIEYIKNNYQQDLYLERLAEEFNTSDKYLSRLFKETVGMGFHEYLTSIRISKSKGLLLETNLSVTKIGENVGFTTHSTFFRLFKKNEGISPTQYRENHGK